MSTVAAASLIALLLVFVILNSATRIKCTIRNNSHAAVSGVLVDVAGNKKVIGTLLPGEEFQTTLQPATQAGGVLVSYSLPGGDRKTVVASGYIESRHYGGEVQIVIAPNGEPVVEENSIGLRFFR